MRSLKFAVFARLATLVLVVACGAPAVQAPSPTAAATPKPPADIATAGRLRVALNIGNAALATKDPATGEVRGVTVDLGRALAERIGVSYVALEYASVPKMIDGLKAGAWDIGFLAIDPARDADVEFTGQYMEVDNTYLVAASSPIQTVADVDRPGLRIAVADKSAPDLYLSGVLKQAQLLRAATPAASCDLFVTGKADAFAANRDALLSCSARAAGSRVLSDRFTAVLHAIGVPKGRTEMLAYVKAFIEDAKASGLVKGAIERAGVRGVQVAPRAAR